VVKKPRAKKEPKGDAWANSMIKNSYDEKNSKNS
jgi:hypothetical protein